MASSEATADPRAVDPGEAGTGGAAPTASRRRGRPRAADRTDAILSAATELFEEVGYDQLTVQDIADRAGTGLATIYRRWPTKQALLADALRRRAVTFGATAEGGAAEGLASVFGQVAGATIGPRGELLPGLLTAIRADDELAEGLRVGVIEPMRERIRTELQALLGAGHPHLELLVDLVPGVCVFRSLAPGDAGSPEDVVDGAMELIAQLVAASSTEPLARG